jgi:anti-sigma regulatory factor (Ser/Thr protein kinase)
VFLYLNKNNYTYDIASFGMPPVLVENNDGIVQEIRPNNPPIMNFLNKFKIDSHNFHETKKILLYSDGLDEVTTKDSKLYAKVIQDDFKNSFFKKDFLNTYKEKIEKNSDDLTFIYISNFKEKKVLSEQISINTDVNIVHQTIDNIGDLLINNKVSNRLTTKVKFALNELILNALEHGNLNISYEEKQHLMQNKEFHKHIEEMCSIKSNFDKKIDIDVNIYDIDDNKGILIISVKDEGDGFDFSTFFKYLSFDETVRLHGRGIMMSEGMSSGIFYNKKGNISTIINIFSK